jgi:hypothetical protein
MKSVSLGMLAAVGLIASAGFADGTIKDACGIAPDAFKTWRETSLARRSGWYAKAEKSVPKLYSREVKPVGLVKVQRDAAAFQGWRALPAGELAAAWGRPLNPGDSLTLDLLGKKAIFTSKTGSIEQSGTSVIVGIRPEFLPISENGALNGVAYSTLPSGMETTVKISVGELTLSSVVFGSVDYAVDSPVKFDVVGEKIVLFDSETHDRIAIGSLKI